MQNDHTNDFPRWMYGPDGEAQIFETSADVPEGWSPFQGKAVRNDSKGKTGKKVEKVSATENDVVADTPPTEDEQSSPATEEATAPVEDAESNVSDEITKEYLLGREMKDLYQMCDDLNLSKGGKKIEITDRILAALEEAKKK